MYQQNPAPPTRVVIYPTYRRSAQCCGPDCWKKCALIFFTIMFLLVGFILTMVGNLAKPFYGPEDDWCDFCREDRLTTERNLKNCRIVGPIFLAIGVLLLIATIVYTLIQRKNNAGKVITGPNTGQIGSTTQGGTGNATTTTQYPSPYGFQQPYGQTPVYPPGTGPYPPPPAGYSSYPTGPAYPSSTQYPYTSPQSDQAPYPTEMPPPPSYESTVGQSDSTPSAPPAEKMEV